MKQPIIGIVVIALIPIASGCQPKAAQTVTQATVTALSEKCEVELSEPNFVFTPPDLLRFELHYKFVKGRPTKNYMCYLSFPGTVNLGQKPLEAWELQTQGFIKGGIELQSLDPPVKTFEIKLGEAEVPQSGYEIISNTLTGDVTLK